MTDFVTLESLKQQSPAQILSFLEQADNSQHDFNWWLGLAQVATLETFRVPGQVNLEWAEVAMRVREILANRDQSISVSRDLMMLKARLIATMGNTEPIPLASVGEIVRWFFDHLTISCDEAEKLTEDMSDHFQSKNISILRQLRDVKLMLIVLQLIETHEQINSNAELQKWLQLKDKLP